MHPGDGGLRPGYDWGAEPVSGEVSNCGNVTLTNMVISSSLYGPISQHCDLGARGDEFLLKLVTNTCGSFPNTVTATGRSTCGTQVSATATNTVCGDGECVPLGDGELQFGLDFRDEYSEWRSEQLWQRHPDECGDQRQRLRAGDQHSVLAPWRGAALQQARRQFVR